MPPLLSVNKIILKTLLLSALTVFLAEHSISSRLQAAPKADEKSKIMDALVHYAETIIKHGRDTYGEKHTPLFSDYLEVNTLKAPEKMYIHRLGGPGPRSKQPFQPVISSNLAYQGNLMRFLVGISELTRDSRYKNAYKECIHYYFANYQAPNGLLQMGHHRWVNLQTDRYDGNDWPAGKSGHEMKRDYPYYPIFWETDPVATRRMLAAHWSSHIQDWGFMNFTRHGSYVKELNEDTLWNHPITKPVIGIVKGNLTFFDSGSDIIYAGAQLGSLSKNKKPLFWAKRLYARYSDSAHPKTGLPPWHHTSLREFGSANEPVPEYALITRGSAGLLGNGGVAMLRIGEDLGKDGQYYRDSMLSHLKAYAKYAYIPKENLLKNLLMDGTDLAEREKQNKAKSGEPPSAAWQPWSPDPNTIIAYAICYKQNKDNTIWETLKSMIRGNGLGDIGDPGGKNTKLNLRTDASNALLIFPLVELFQATKNKNYLELGSVIANNASKKHFRHKQGLFTPSSLHRTANLCSAEPLALLTLEAALRNKMDKIPTYAGSNEGEAVPYLRPLKIRPYKPKASHLAYSYATEAICDDLLPASSSDTGVPVMAWQNIKKATNEATVDFPDILTGPVTIEGMVDHSETRNSVSTMIINSEHSYTFSGNLYGSGDLNFNILKGSHYWSDKSTWSTTGWSPTGTYDFIMNLEKGSKLTFNGLIRENQGTHTWSNGAGIIKNGPGAAELTADYSGIYNRDIRNNRSYRGSTIINDGLLLISNKEGSGISPSSNVIVNHGGTLGGTGTIGLGSSSSEVTVNAGGKITPGNEIGTLTLKDGLTLNKGARLEFDAGEKSDLLKITGGTFRGTGKSGVVITVRDSGGMAPGKNYDLIDWTGASFVDVDVSDFRLDKSKTFQGSFHIVDTKLQFSVFAPRLVPETPPELPPKPEPKKKKIITGHLPPKVSNFVWTNSSGGNWSNSENWKDNKIPNSKETEWVDYTFEKAQKISGTSVYWFDNGGDKKIPKSWRILYRDEAGWKPVQSIDPYTVNKDIFNEVRFKPIETKTLRLEVNLQPGVSSGIHEWKLVQ